MTVRNLAFVNSEWNIEAQIQGGEVIAFQGETYDSGLYILKESELLTVWKYFRVEVRVKLAALPLKELGFLRQKELEEEELGDLEAITSKSPNRPKASSPAPSSGMSMGSVNDLEI